MADDLEDLRAEVARLKAELRAARALHAATVESLPFDFWARDREGYCFTQNSTTLANWGDLRGKRPEDMDLPREVIEKWVENNRRALAGETVRGDTDYVINGETRHFHNVLAPIRLGDTIAGTLGVNIDVTELKRRDEQLRQAQKIEAVGQLTAGIAHNFNNMLMGVLPNLELAARLASPEIVPLLESALHSARRAAELVRKLTTYAGRNRPVLQRVEDVSAIVARTVELCRTTFDGSISFDEDYEPSATARVDAAQIEQAVLNVLINARDALDPPPPGLPRVSVSVSVVRGHAVEPDGAREDRVRVRVTDNGAGMDAATLARMYEPFFTTKEVGKGTGLGLATTRAIVREHGGFIACESEPRRGTTLSMYLLHTNTPSERAPAAPQEARSRGTETILVIDDEAGIRQVVGLLLRTAGYVVHAAASGTAALELLADRRFAADVALVLLDVSMPGLPRAELRRRLREMTRARVVYFTGYAFEAADADDTVLEKPVTEERLLLTIREVLDRP